MTKIAPDTLPSGFLFDLLCASGLQVRGQTAAAAFQDSTNLSHMSFRRLGAEAFSKYKEEIENYQRKVWFPEQLRAWGTPENEIPESLASIQFTGVVAVNVSGLGFRGPEVSAHLKDTVELLDEADSTLLALQCNGDIAECLGQLGPDSVLGPAYCEPLDVAGIGALIAPPAENVGLIEWVRVRRAHMALSLLAALDHEMSMWRERQVGDDEWKGLPRFAPLLLEPCCRAQQRYRPDDPIARLVDMVGAVADCFENARWPEVPPSLDDMGRRVDASRKVDQLGRTFIKKLRSGHTRMTGRNFRTLVVSQFEGANKPVTFDSLALASMLLPYLFAAHLLTTLIPSDPSGRRLDRTGWRSAYLVWWRRHAVALGRPTERVNNAVPLWLTGPLG